MKKKKENRKKKLQTKTAKLSRYETKITIYKINSSTQTNQYSRIRCTLLHAFYRNKNKKNYLFCVVIVIHVICSHSVTVTYWSSFDPGRSDHLVRPAL